MKNISKITEEVYIFQYLEKRGLVLQYQKAKNHILFGMNQSLKMREPKKDDIWYFRINKQFRAYAHIENNTELVVFKIDNHQNS